ncbi:MAG: hypothetical protein ACQEQO_00925 [Thermodesulfobacteriota bacterium]
MTGRRNMADKALAGRWSDTMDITAMSSEAEGKIITKMHGCPVSLKQMNLQRNMKRTGHD